MASAAQQTLTTRNAISKPIYARGGAVLILWGYPSRYSTVALLPFWGPLKPWTNTGRPRASEHPGQSCKGRQMALIMAPGGSGSPSDLRYAHIQGKNAATTYQRKDELAAHPAAYRALNLVR
ncbi:hypothetical protein FALBO_17254 [Fusarium albosuccineum]|uniref:Uncharacterized protein n=1 Tax=Fusarium albosuccineum TaxID=1237068 RepID=A0A8H4K4V6_9HYPO|nr:hypothetical protein FALBO_17254 [Fusarium albosuccineum]KAF4980225.1 hypothetical protein FDECE_17922 [Fusarium decemcellulare]